MQFLRKFTRSHLATLGLAVVLVVVISALFAPWLVPFDPADQDIMQRMLPPLARSDTGALHLFGTDALGRDLLSRLIVGSRVSLLVGVASVLISGVLGVVLGLLAGYDDRHLGRVLMGVADVQLAVPFLVLALAVVAVLGPSLFNLVLVLGVTSWVQFARIVRAEVLVLREREFVQAAQALGASGARLMFRHLLPNVMSSVIVIGSMQVGKMILFEASLSFLGLGVPSDIPTWGGMIADGRTYVSTEWWLSAVPGLAIFITVVGINLLGDRLRDLLDPRLNTLER
ncbi:ABC transporter permease [Variovorax boronicumulans]|jgi:peptide/nickel transport system permease protein|uniref:ABC transporter permease n=1 Tax=Variovorax boronicumulans TaxID=436515 RepID=UPI001C55AB93